MSVKRSCFTSRTENLSLSMVWHGFRKIHSLEWSADLRMTLPEDLISATICSTNILRSRHLAIAFQLRCTIISTSTTMWRSVETTQYAPQYHRYPGKMSWVYAASLMSSTKKSVPSETRAKSRAWTGDRISPETLLRHFDFAHQREKLREEMLRCRDPP